MARNIPKNFIESLLAKVNIVDLISQYVELKRTGTYFSGLCPFHGDTDPSFKVNPARQFFHCFGCHKGGNAITFLMEYHGYSFVEAVTALAESVGETVQFQGNSQKSDSAFIKKKKSYLELNRVAERFFKDQLARNTHASKYLVNRGVSSKMVENFSIGYAPDEWEGLYRTFISFSSESCGNAEQIGLLIANNNNGFYDRFRDRIMFPVYNLRGDVVGFSGRALKKGDKTAKYLNSPDSKIFHKGKLLFGIEQARKQIIQKKRIIVVEGNLDVVLMHQNGFNETVAPLGTAFTPNQAILLNRFTNDIILMYDGDEAGEKATKKSIEILLKIGLNPSIVRLPQGEDPDSFLRKSGKTGMEELIKNKQYSIEYLINRYLLPFKNNPVMAGHAFGTIIPFLNLLKNPVEKDAYTRTICSVLKITRDEFRQYVAQIGKSIRTVQAKPKKINYDKHSSWLFLLSILIDSPELAKYLDDTTLKSFGDTTIRTTLEQAKLFITEHGKLSPDFIAGITEKGKISEQISTLFISESMVDTINMEQAFLDILQKTKQDALSKKYTNLKTLLKKGEMNNEEKKKIMKKAEAMRKELLKSKLLASGRK